MQQLTEKPHLIFFLSIPIIILIGILIGDNVLDINVHDTYFVIAYYLFAILISIIFGIIGFGYWIIQKVDRKLSKWLNCIHIGLTFGGVFFVWILSKLYRPEIMDYKFNNNLSLIITLVVLIIIAGQLIFPINIIYALTKKKIND